MTNGQAIRTKQLINAADLLDAFVRQLAVLFCFEGASQIRASSEPMSTPLLAEGGVRVMGKPLRFDDGEMIVPPGCRAISRDDNLVELMTASRAFDLRCQDLI